MAKHSESRILTELRTKLLDERTKEIAIKVLEHQVRKDILEFNKETIKEKQDILNEEKLHLEEINKKKYKLQSDFCDSVWKFSREHNFGHFLVNYPRKRVPPACNCEFFQENSKKIEKEVEENEEIKKLSCEVAALKLELAIWENKTNLEEEIINVSKTIKFPSEQDNEIQRLTKILENSQQELESLEIEMRNSCQKQDEFTKNSETAISKVKTKRLILNDKKPTKRLKTIKETSREIPRPTLSCLNTIDNYLILKGKHIAPVDDDELLQEKEEKIVETSRYNNHNQESGVLQSWTLNSNAFRLEDSMEKLPEQRPVFSAFTPKKQSTIAEKLKKHNK